MKYTEEQLNKLYELTVAFLESDIKQSKRIISKLEK